MWAYRFSALAALFVTGFLGWYVYTSEVTSSRPFRLGLDLSGGTQLLYRADTSAIAGDTEESLDALRETIERRVNLFGVAEPLVQREKGSSIAGEGEERLIIELPGVTDANEAIRQIGETPVLEFRMLTGGEDVVLPGTSTLPGGNDLFGPAILTGRHIARAELQFGSAGGLANEPVVVLFFDNEGTKIFADTTAANVGKMFGIFLDGEPISTPVINEAIPGGTAVISGQFTAVEARDLVKNINFGALPVPIELVSTQTVSGTLGGEAVRDGIYAGILGFGLVALFMILWYRLPGLLAVLALSLYVTLSLALFKFIPVTLTAAGIAAFILSIGMAVDANVLIFARIKEELRRGKMGEDAVREGFNRAWNSIRDSNISSIITAIILFWFGTSIVKGFALVFALGVLVSMFSAISVSRTYLLAFPPGEGRFSRFFYGSGIKN